MLKGDSEKRMMGNGTLSRILSYTSGACDARMAGAMIPVMSNSGSGNQGISATLPVVIYAEENEKTEEELINLFYFKFFPATAAKFTVNFQFSSTKTAFFTQFRHFKLLLKSNKYSFLSCNYSGLINFSFTFYTIDFIFSTLCFH